MSVLRDIETLRAAIASVEPRHAVELAGVVAGAKRVARVVVTRDERDRAAALIARLCLRVESAPFALATEFETSLGDRFMYQVPCDDPRAESFVLLAAQTRADAREACEVERVGDNEALGALYEYPPCCVAAYARIAEGADWVEALVGTASVPTPARANRIASLFEGYGLLPDYFPCALGCEGAVRLAALLRLAALSVGLDALVETTDATLRRPMLVWRGLLIQPLDAQIRGGVVTFDGSRALRFDWRPEDDFANALLDGVRAATVDGGGLTLRDGRGEALGGGNDPRGRLLTFVE